MKKVLSIIVLLTISCATLIFSAWLKDNGPTWTKNDNNKLKTEIEVAEGLIIGTCLIGVFINIVTHCSSQMPVEGDHLKKCGGCQAKRDKYVGTT